MYQQRPQNNLVSLIIYFLGLLSSYIIIINCLIQNISSQNINKINYINIDVNTNNSYTYVVYFDSCKYIDNNIWYNITTMHNYVNSYYSIDTSYYTTKYGNNDNYYCDVISKSKYNETIILTCLGFLSFLIMVYAIFYTINGLNKRSEYLLG